MGGSLSILFGPYVGLMVNRFVCPGLLLYAPMLSNSIVQVFILHRLWQAI